MAEQSSNPFSFARPPSPRLGRLGGDAYENALVESFVDSSARYEQQHALDVRRRTEGVNHQTRSPSKPVRLTVWKPFFVNKRRVSVGTRRFTSNLY
jgi:hypothetical protein